MIYFKTLFTQILRNQVVIMSALESILDDGNRKEEVRYLMETASNQTAKILGVSEDENKKS